MSLLRLYRLDESVPKGATAVVGNWQEAETYWPGCSTAWDEMQLAGDPDELVDLFQIGPLLFASVEGQRVVDDDYYLFVPRSTQWAGIGKMTFQRMGAFVKLQTPLGTSGAALYVPASRTIPYIDVVGPKPEEIPGFSPSARPNGNVSAQKKEPSAEDIRQAALAVQNWKKAQP